MLREHLKNFSPLYSAYMRLRIARESLAMRRAAARGEGVRDGRRMHAFCVGAAKTGTSSMAVMFGKNYRSRHEPMSYHFHHFWGGRDVIEGERGLDGYLLRRDRYLDLEMEASHFLLPALPALVRLFPEAKFVLTVRDCLPWMVSMMSEELFTRGNRKSYLWWEPWFRHVCGPAAGHPAEEARLAAAGLSTVRGYLRYWERHNREVIAAVPAERLLILRLDELDTAQESLAEFLGIAADSLPQSEVRINTRKAKEIELEDLGIDYVKQIARQECGELMERFFPGTQLK